MTENTPDAADLTRPIIGINNRTPLEVFDIMCDRFTRAMQAPTPTPAGAGDLVERLRWGIPEKSAVAGGGQVYDFNALHALMTEAASRIEALEAEVARLTERRQAANARSMRLWAQMKEALTLMDAAEARATTAEADIAALRAEGERKDGALRRAGESIQDFIQITRTQRPSLAHDTLNEVLAALAPAKAGG